MLPDLSSVQWVHGENFALHQQTVLAIEQAISQQARVPSSNSHGILSFDIGRWSGTKQDLARRDFLTHCPSPFSSTSSSSTSSTSGPQPVKTGGRRLKVGEASRTFTEFMSDLTYLSPRAMPEPVGAFYHPTTITDDEELRRWLKKRRRQMAEMKHKED
ncbi:unnamed protein product [Penicillium palitans]